MEGDIKVSLDKLPIKRLEALDENGFERFASDVDYDEKRVSLIRKIDFAWAIEREDPGKKQKTAGGRTKEATSSQQQWQWQSLVENLRLAHQELMVIIDLINTVEENDAVSVVGMTRPKQLLNEHLSDLAVSTVTKLQCFKSLGKYFKQSAKALEEQTAREARFYGALMRLQQNWKIKRHRLVAAVSGNEGFYIDLFNNPSHDLAPIFRPSSLCTVPIDHDPSGMLTINLPRSACHSLQFEFLGVDSVHSVGNLGQKKMLVLRQGGSKESADKPSNDDESIQEMHLTLRQVHCAIHDEQIFDLVNRDASNSPMGLYLTGIKEKYLSLRIGEGTSVSISLVSSAENGEIVCSSVENTRDTLSGANFQEADSLEHLAIPVQHSFEIYLRQLFFEHAFMKANPKIISSLRSQTPTRTVSDSSSILGHFCKALAHRIFSKKVLLMLEHLVQRTPYVKLLSNPTWHSRTSTWTISMKLPQSILHAGSQIQTSSIANKNVRSQFLTKIVVIDESITIEGEGSPSVISLFKGKSDAVITMDKYDCDLVTLPTIILLQVASQIIQWLHEEALIVGLKASRDFLSLALELKQGEIVRLVAHVDPDDKGSCISWWLTVENRSLASDIDNVESENRKLLGYLPLDVLYSTLLDLLNLSNH